MVVLVFRVWKDTGAECGGSGYTSLVSGTSGGGQVPLKTKSCCPTGMVEDG